MMPTDKVTEAELEQPKASAIHPFDRFMKDVYARKNNDPFSSDPLMQERVGTESADLSDNGETSGARSDKLRAEIIARAREAEERAREATERYKQIEANSNRSRRCGSWPNSGRERSKRNTSSGSRLPRPQTCRVWRRN
jgi:hypothetical protein